MFIWDVILVTQYINNRVTIQSVIVWLPQEDYGSDILLDVSFWLLLVALCVLFIVTFNTISETDK